MSSNSSINKFLLKLTIASFLFFYINLISAQQFQPGTTYFDSTGFVEYLAGNLPVVISVPHGGYVAPDSIPDRDCTGCSYLRDSYTQEIGRGLIDAFYDETGCYPHVIINLLHRRKFDANRDIGDAADGNPLVELAWYGYHELIDSAKAKIVQDYGRGLFLDLHGHAHDIERIELGYLLSGSELRLSDATLNTTTYIEESSIRTLVGDNLQSLTHSELLRGDHSFGTLLHEKGFPSVPSTSDPFPEIGESYFSGGYNTVRHGSRDDNGDIDGIQIECNSDIRFTVSLREMLIDSLTTVVNEYMDLHYDDQYLGNYCTVLLPVELLNFKASQVNKSVSLHWSTASESNNDFFEIQRSTDGRSFNTIGHEDGSGNSTVLTPYHFDDHNPIIGMNYYRLKQIDFDGRFDYSEVISVEVDNSKKTVGSLSPNPSLTGLVYLDYFSEKEEGVSIAIFNITGQLIQNQFHQLSAGKNNLILDYSFLSVGIYFLKVEGGGLMDYRKLVIQ